MELLLHYGGTCNDSKKKPTSKQAQAVKETQPKVNEKKIPRRYLLTALREGGFYEPLTDEEFEEFRRQNPEVAKYFLVQEDGQTDVAPVSEIPVHDVNESLPIFDHWEKAALKLMASLQRHQYAWIFAEPVDEVALNIPDYYTIVKNPMDFGTIKTKLKECRYTNVGEFMADMN